MKTKTLKRTLVLALGLVSYVSLVGCDYYEMKTDAWGNTHYVAVSGGPR